MPPLGLRVLNYVLFGACCLQTAQVTNSVIAQELQPSAPVQAAPAVAPVDTPPDWAARAPILERNLFAVQVAGDAPPPVVEAVDENLEDTKLPLSLVGTLASTGPSSRAAIVDNRTRKSQVLQTGDEVEGHPEVRIDRIERGRVLLINQGRREQLLLSEEDGSDGAPRPVAAATERERRPRRVARPPRRATAPDPDRFRARRQAVQEDPRHRERLDRLRERLEAAGEDQDSRLAVLEEEARRANERARSDPDAVDDPDAMGDEDAYLDDGEGY